MSMALVMLVQCKSLNKLKSTMQLPVYHLQRFQSVMAVVSWAVTGFARLREGATIRSSRNGIHSQSVSLCDLDQNLGREVEGDVSLRVRG
jgi:hypothetical protein